jgi:hypothetical protein
MMSFEERGAWSAILSSIVAFALWGRPIWIGTATGAYDGAEGLSLWAWDVIRLIGYGVALAVAMLVLFNLAYALASRDGKLRFNSDERDASIGRRSATVSLAVVSGGFLLAVGLLAAGWSGLAALNAMLVGMAMAGIGSEASRIAAYRLGL